MRYLYTGLIVITALSLMFYDDLATAKFQGTSFFSAWISGVVPGDDLKAEVDKLKAENESLRVQIANPENSSIGEVKVYSSYPFNGKRDISIAGGSNFGFRKGDAVTINQRVLVGQIIEVLDKTSVVKIIYDSGWEIAVRIGEHEVDALFKGGLSPKVGFIKADAEIKPGDIVLTASPGLPYGLEIGKIKSVKDFPGSPFKEADLEVVFSLNTLRDVSVRR
jgi:cell shape-determining protein MreC